MFYSIIPLYKITVKVYNISKLLFTRKMMKKYINLFLTMLKIGFFTFGGGYAMLALLENEFITKKKWMDKDEFLNMVAIAESTPGPIAINAATYIGYKSAGFCGAISSTVGVCIPSFAIIYAISLFFDAFLSLTLAAYAFKGIQIGVVYLILSAGLKMLKSIKKTPLNIVIMLTVGACTVTFSVFAIKFSTIFYILLSGAVGVFFYLIGRIKRADKEEKK